MGLLRSKSEFLKVGFSHPLPLDSPVNFRSRHFPLLCQPVREHHHGFSREEVKHPIVNPLIACPEFVDAISQKVCLRPPEFVSQLAETIDPLRTLGFYLRRELVKPIQKRH